MAPPGIDKYSEHLVLLARIHLSRAIRCHQALLSARTPDAAERYRQTLRLQDNNAASHFRECDLLRDDGSRRSWTAEERAQLALEMLDGDIHLAPALEAALWKMLLRLHRPDFELRCCGVTVSRLDVAIYAFFMFGCMCPVPSAEQLFHLRPPPIDAPPPSAVNQQWVQFWSRHVRLAAPSSVFHDIPFDLALSNVPAVFAVRGATFAASARDPTFDAALPSIEHTAKIAFIAASKGVYSFAIPVAATVAHTDGGTVPQFAALRLATIEVVRLLPSDVPTTVDSAFKPRDAASVLSQLAHFANFERRNQLAVILSQLAIARWRCCTKAWVTLHDALRALNAAVVLPSLDNELFNSADCYLEAIKLERAGSSNSNPNPNTAHFELGLKRHYDPHVETTRVFVLRLALFASVAVLTTAVLRLTQK